jgi:hypothetical protein
MKPFWKMKKMLEIEDDFRWATMLGLRGFWRLHCAPIQEELVYDFLKGFKSIDEVEIRAIVQG